MAKEPRPTQVPDEILLQSADLSNGTKTALDQLVGFVQENDGFTYTAYQSREFDFSNYGCRFTGSYRYEPLSETADLEMIDITRYGNGLLDHCVVKINPHDSRTPFLITYSDLARGDTMKKNSYGALRKTLGITQSPAPQDQAV